MRLGAYPCKLVPKTCAFDAYHKPVISERHRHRYEVNNKFRGVLSTRGLSISGLSPDEKLVEIIEYPQHPWFVAAQFHPEFQSKPDQAHPLFRMFIGAALRKGAL